LLGGQKKLESSLERGPSFVKKLKKTIPDKETV
jgi:hypothetical protein